jgi:LysM repeat protein
VTTFHAAVDHIDPATLETTTTYCGIVDQDHVDQVRAIAALDTTERWAKEHPRLEGAFCVLRDDGDLDVYVPTDAAEYRVYAPDPDAKGDNKDLPRGLSGPAYISGAIRLGDQSIGGASDSPSKPPRAVWHTTESPAGGNYLTSIGAYLIRVGSEPQVIYCPVTDRIGQFGPLTSSGRALQNDGSYRTNRTGKVCIQVEVLGYAKSPWTKGFDPSKKPNYQRLIAAMRAHGIPDVWPVGKPPATAAAATKRPRDTWENEGGHFGHSQIRGQSHWDPGAIDTSIVPGKATSTPAPSTGGGTSSGGTYKVEKDDTLTSIAAEHKTTVAALVKLNGLKDPDKLSVGQELKLPGTAASKPAAQPLEPFPGAGFFHGGRHSAIVTAMGRRLVAEGCNRYSSGPGPNWTNSDRNSYAAWQRKLGYSGSAADGIPGKASWEKLRVPKS